MKNHQPTSMGGMGDGVGDIMNKPVFAAKCLHGHSYLLVAVGALHKNGLPLGNKTPLHAGQGLGDCLQGPGDDSLDGATKRSLNLFPVDLHPFQTQSLHDFAKELDSLLPSLGEDDPCLRTRHLERNAGQARPGADVEYRGGKPPPEQPGNEDTVDVVLLNHIVELMDSGEIVRRVPSSQESVKSPELSVLILCERDFTPVKPDLE